MDKAQGARKHKFGHSPTLERATRNRITPCAGIAKYIIRVLPACGASLNRSARNVFVPMSICPPQPCADAPLILQTGLPAGAVKSR